MAARSQTKLSHREGHEARRVGLEAMPLDQQIKRGHGERGAVEEIAGEVNCGNEEVRLCLPVVLEQKPSNVATIS